MPPDDAPWQRARSEFAHAVSPVPLAGSALPFMHLSHRLPEPEVTYNSWLLDKAELSSEEMDLAAHLIQDQLAEGTSFSLGNVCLPTIDESLNAANLAADVLVGKVASLCDEVPSSATFTVHDNDIVFKEMDANFDEPELCSAFDTIDVGPEDMADEEEQLSSPIVAQNAALAERGPSNLEKSWAKTINDWIDGSVSQAAWDHGLVKFARDSLNVSLDSFDLGEQVSLLRLMDGEISRRCDALSTPCDPDDSSDIHISSDRLYTIEVSLAQAHFGLHVACQVALREPHLTKEHTAVVHRLLASCLHIYKECVMQVHMRVHQMQSASSGVSPRFPSSKERTQLVSIYRAMTNSIPVLVKSLCSTLTFTDIEVTAGVSAMFLFFERYITARVTGLGTPGSNLFVLPSVKKNIDFMCLIEALQAVHVRIDAQREWIVSKLISAFPFVIFQQDLSKAKVRLVGSVPVHPFAALLARLVPTFSMDQRVALSDQFEVAQNVSCVKPASEEVTALVENVVSNGIGSELSTPSGRAVIHALYQDWLFLSQFADWSGANLFVLALGHLLREKSVAEDASWDALVFDLGLLTASVCRTQLSKTIAIGNKRNALRSSDGSPDPYISVLSLIQSANVDNTAVFLSTVLQGLDTTASDALWFPVRSWLLGQNPPTAGSRQQQNAYAGLEHFFAAESILPFFLLHIWNRAASALNPATRAKSLRTLCRVYVPFTQCYPELSFLKLVSERLCEDALQVRDAALDLIAESISFTDDLVPLLADRLNDPMASIRKKAILTAKGLLLRNTDLGIAIFSKIADIDDNVRETAVSAIKHALSSLDARAQVSLAVEYAGRNLPSPIFEFCFLNLLSALANDATDVLDAEASAGHAFSLVDFVQQCVWLLEDRETLRNNERLQCAVVLDLCWAFDCNAVSRFARDLVSLIELLGRDSMQDRAVDAERAIYCRSLHRNMTARAPGSSLPPYAEALQWHLVQLMRRPVDGLLKEAVPCLVSVIEMTHASHVFWEQFAFACTMLCRGLESIDMESKPGQKSRMILHGALMIALLGRLFGPAAVWRRNESSDLHRISAKYFDLLKDQLAGLVGDDPLVQALLTAPPDPRTHAAFALFELPADAHLSTTSFHILSNVYERVPPFLKNGLVKALGEIFVYSPWLMLEAPWKARLLSMIKASPLECATVLSILTAILTHYMDQSEEDAHVTAQGIPSHFLTQSSSDQQADKRVEIEVGIVQQFLPSVLVILGETDMESCRDAAFTLVERISSSGLVHPLQVVPTLVSLSPAMASQENEASRRRSIGLLSDLYQAHGALFASRTRESLDSLFRRWGIGYSVIEPVESGGTPTRMHFVENGTPVKKTTMHASPTKDRRGKRAAWTPPMKVTSVLQSWFDIVQGNRDCCNDFIVVLKAGFERCQSEAAAPDDVSYILFLADATSTLEFRDAALLWDIARHLRRLVETAILPYSHEIHRLIDDAENDNVSLDVTDSDTCRICICAVVFLLYNATKQRLKTTYVTNLTFRESDMAQEASNSKTRRRGESAPMRNAQPILVDWGIWRAACADCLNAKRAELAVAFDDLVKNDPDWGEPDSDEDFM